MVLFFSRSLDSSDRMNRTPDLLICLWSFARIMAFKDSSSAECSKSQSMSAAEWTLFTFCPPGPRLSEALKVMSLKSKEGGKLVFTGKHTQILTV